MYNYKESIQTNYNRCVAILDRFDEFQIKAIYQYIMTVNSVSNTYELFDEPNRTSVLAYLIQLKLNNNEEDEYAVYNRMFNILTAMIAMELLREKYNEK